METNQLTYDLNRNEIPEGLSGGFFVYNALGNEEVYFADRNVQALFGCSSMEEFREHTGNSFRGMVHPDDINKVERNILAQTFHSGKRHDYVRYRIITRQGEIRHVEDFGHLLLQGEDGFCFCVFIVGAEAAGLENTSVAEMQIFSENRKVDRLTGLLNMSTFSERFQAMLSGQTTQDNRMLSVVVLDILGLKEINRSLGREEGDERICALANAARDHLPQNSLVFRGDEAELVVIAPCEDEQALLSEIMQVIRACKSEVLYGIGTIGDGQAFNGNGTAIQALEEAHLDLKVKKMLHSKSEHSQALTSLVRALEEVDADTEAHVQRTQQMGIALGHKIGLPDAQVTLLQLLCLLHDIGKIGVPLEILNKPGKLTDEEWAVLRSHAEKGYQIAMASDELKPIAEMILHHHERWDGKGYPARMAGDEIPVLSRIISLVDAYDAMVNDRAYRKAMLPEAAKQEIRDNAGTQFDPHLAALFLELLEENPELSVGKKTGGVVRLFRQSDELADDSTALTGSTSPVMYTKYSLDIDERIIEVDDFFERMTGYPREEVIGKMTQFDLIPDEEREYYIHQVMEQFKKGDIAYLRHPIRRRDGRVIEVICNGERYFDSSVKAFRSTLLVFEV